MPKKILFSPIGGTDPIRYFRDGSMLHICRHYRPDLVYLYLSHEMMEFHRADNRYIDALERLGVLLDHRFEIRLIERDELINVQQYDVFYQDFRNEILKIENEMEEGDELLLNMASGTPAMKSALFVMATFAEYRFQPIQVSTPKRKMNSEYEQREAYENKIAWERYEDNAKDAPDRCTEVKSLNLMQMLQTEIIKKHISAYDYTAALEVARGIRDGISEDAFCLLQIMDARVKLNRTQIRKLTIGKTYDIYPVKGENDQKIFEYALVLQMKVKKEEYADFIRGITPLVVDLLEMILSSRCHIDLKNCCETDGDMLRWDKNKLKQAGLLDLLNSKYRGNFTGGPVYSGPIAKIIEYKCRDTALIRNVNEITRIEGKVRNVAAHEIVSVTDEWFQTKTGKSAKEIFQILKFLIEKSGIPVKEADWNSYDRMNQEICRYLR